MKIIANTKDGFLIEATISEVDEILKAVLGEAPEKIKVGQKIPAIDYASTIRKIKSLKDSYEFKNLCSYADEIAEKINGYKRVVEMASKIDTE